MYEEIFFFFCEFHTLKRLSIPETKHPTVQINMYCIKCKVFDVWCSFAKNKQYCCKPKINRTEYYYWLLNISILHVITKWNWTIVYGTQNRSATNICVWMWVFVSCILVWCETKRLHNLNDTMQTLENLYIQIFLWHHIPKCNNLYTPKIFIFIKVSQFVICHLQWALFFLFFYSLSVEINVSNRTVCLKMFVTQSNEVSFVYTFSSPRVWRRLSESDFTSNICKSSRIEIITSRFTVLLKFKFKELKKK